MARIRSELRAVFKADNKQFLRTVKGTKRVIGALVAATAAIGAGAVTGAGLAIRRFMSFEKQMSEVNTIAKLGQKEFQKLTKDVMDLSAEFGQSKDALTKGLYDALSAGVPSENAIDFLKDASKLAIAGATDTATAVDLLTSVINAYGKEAGKAGDISDQLFKTVEFGKTTIPELAQAIGMVAPIAAQAGVETEQLLGAFASLTKQGVKTDIASTALRGTLTQLLKPSKDLEKQMRKTFGTTNAQAIFQTNTLQEVLAELGDAVDNDASKMAKLFPNVRALNGILALTGKGAGVARQGLDTVTKRVGATDRAMSEFTDDAGFKFSQMRETLDNEFTKIGEMLAGELKEPMETFVEFLQDPKTQEAIKSFSTGLVGAIQTVSAGLRDLINLYTLMRQEAAKFTKQDIVDIQAQGGRLSKMSTGELKTERLKTRAKMAAFSAIPGYGVKGALEAREQVKMLDELIKQRQELEKIRAGLPQAQEAQ